MPRNECPSPAARRPRLSVILLAIIVLVLSGATAHGAEDEPVTAFDIPAGPLERSLNRLASQAGITLSFQPEAVAGKRAPALSGEYVLDAALDRLLEGTGLTYRLTGDARVVVAAGDESLAPIDVRGAAAAAADAPVDGYRAARSATATRADTAIQDTPASVQVVPRDVIEDQQAFELGEVLRNVSGVTGGEGSTLIEARETVFTRGFRSRAVYYDGFRAGSLPTLDLANIERVEVLKGPASIVAGQIEPGGLVNLVPKKPGRSSRGSVGLRVGEYDFRRLEADVTGVTGDGALGARLNASATDAGSFRDFVETEREFVTPTLRYDLGNRGEIELGLLRYRSQRPFDEGVAFGADGSPAPDISTYLGGPDLAGSDFDWNGLRLTADYDVTDSLTLRAGVFHQAFEHDWEAFRPSGDPGEEPVPRPVLAMAANVPVAAVPADPVADDEIFRFYDDTTLEVDTTEVRLEALQRFSTAGWDHELLVGLNARRLERDLVETRGFDVVDPATGEFLPQKIDTRDPRYGDAVPTQNVADGTLDGEQDELGFFVQDSIVGGARDQVRLLAGLRHDEVEQEAVADRAQQKLAGAGRTERDDKTDEAITGRLGALYRLGPRWAPFVSYSESFSPSGTKVSGSTGELLDATTGQQLEAGVKFSLLEGGLAGTASLYRIDRQDVPIEDADNPGQFVNGGEQRSEGLELDLAGRVTEDVEVLASLGTTDAEWTESTNVPEGTPLRGVPDYTASVSGRWRIASGPLQGFRLTGTVFTADSRPGDERNTFELDGYTTATIGLARNWRIGSDTLRTRFVVKNVTDEQYFASSNSKASVVPGEPRTAVASLEWGF